MESASVPEPVDEVVAGESASSASSPRRATLRAVAEAAGVSTATASYVFSGRRGPGAGVSPGTARRVHEAAARLHYRPNRAAQAIRTGRTEMVQLSLYMLSDPWALAVAEAVNEAANRHGLTTLILADGDWHAALERVESDVAYLDRIEDDAETRRKLQSLVGRGQRLVVFSETLEADGFDVIRSLSLPGCELAMDALLERHTEIGCLAAQSAVDASATQRTRYSVYREKLAAAGLPYRPEHEAFFAGTQATAFTAAVELLSRPKRPSAIYATTDFAGIAAINAAHMLGLRVPHDVAVIGVGNTPDAHLIAPTLTTVGPTDFYERQAQIIVGRAVQEQPDPPRMHEFPWSLFPGGSTDLDAPPARA
ncbi:LacI family DNA-binding transcriptional regulator [uncultured Microbacterium sp.]|uniref:LacI family DNA-binding transcriptional regulator n=1 Tax=uncultured Microbacterium sp. TaxID=191216 RepID=UPI0025F8C72F|nr:LacI family DNA-binding transcriptional regulator [uncultured Microbacterium sp.]